MPCQILAVKYRVVYGDVLTLPEGVLGKDVGMVYLHILTILEHIFSIALEAIDIDILAEHERIGAAVQLHVLQTKAIDLPECLVSIGDIDILQYHVLHLTEKFRAVNTTTTHHQVVGVPDSRT